MSNLTPFEQYMLELVNRARADPAAEAARLGITLNQNLRPGTISAEARAPLAANDALNDAAAGHSRFMLGENVFSHRGRDASDAGRRIADEGYDWRAWGENISYRGGGNARTRAVLEDQHEDMFRSAGHRENILDEAFDEIGVGWEFGRFDRRPAAVVTQNFATDGSGPFLLGVVFDDRDRDGVFDPGEELPGVSVSVAGEGRAATGPGGGYELRVGEGQTLAVTFSGGGLEGPVARTVAVGEENVKLDLIREDAAPGRPSPSPSGPATVLKGGGGPDILTGLAGAEVIRGLGGADTIFGGGGDDLIKGQGGADVARGGAGNDTIKGDGGADRLFGDGGEDILKGGGGRDFIKGGDDDDLLRGGGGADTLKGERGDDELNGGGGRDKLRGGADNDVVNGQGGADRLFGDGGDDTLDGGGGADLLKGGPGEDVFVFSGGFGDVIVDFTSGEDLIEIRGGPAAFDDLTLTDAGDGAGVAHDDGFIRLRLVEAASLDAEDFVFT